MEKSIRDNLARLQASHRPREYPINHPRPDRPLTEKQSRLLRYVREYIDLHGAPPSATVGARFLKISTDAFLSAVKALVRKGYLNMDYERTRTIELTGKQPPL